MTLGLPMMPERSVVDGVALVSDRTAAEAGVAFCFTERTGGVSSAPFASLNLGGRCGDDPANVAENRRRVLRAMGAPDLFGGLVVPAQVHGDEVVVIGPSGASDPVALEQGCDAVVCTVPDTAVMLLFADCAPVVMCAPGGFAVAHSGWRGTFAGIAAKTALVLSDACGCPIDEVDVWVGPHIGPAAYEVSEELVASFEAKFGAAARHGDRNLDLGACIRIALEDAGARADRVVDCGLCTATLTDRFFSHRAEHGRTGRHAAVAFMR